MCDLALPTHAISVRQPWADLFFGTEDGERIKTVEFRKWRLHEQWLGVSLALHATKGKQKLLDFYKGWGDQRLRFDLGVIGIVVFDRCSEFTAATANEDLWSEPGFRLCGRGTWLAWHVATAVAVLPVTCPGHLGIWSLSEEVRAALRYQYAQGVGPRFVDCERQAALAAAQGVLV
jgi:hypothetical protein